MKQKNDIDCVALKDEIQAQLRLEFQGLSDIEQRDRIRQELETSDSIAARKWRMTRENAPSGSRDPSIISVA
ncbi:MAG TPA: hypothetical protein PLI09_18550 [Candidatus Hydrogenedentes bacterium]|nr:hypothetical protein [Candidatus Hydrogenedentota bacterium]